MAAVSSILLGVAAVGAVGAGVASTKAAREQRKMNEIQRRQADLNAASQRRDEVRSNRIKRSQAVINAEGQGVSQSSGAMGGQDSILSQGYSNLSFLDTMNTLSDQASAAYGKSIKYSNTASIFSGISNLAMAFYSPVTKPAEAAATASPGSNLSGGAKISYRGSQPTAHAYARGR